MTLHTSPGFSTDATTGFSGELVRSNCGADAAA
jgi:hypothetical protein